jgi:LuxR family transcriptional regulator, maltose regulon positive regulatory protein
MLEAQAAAPKRNRRRRNPASPAAAHAELSLPRRSRTSVPRPALLERLIGAADARLAVVVAPAGYGKSTLLAQWAERDERRFVWIALDQLAVGSAELTAEAIIAALAEDGMIQPATSAALTGLIPLGAAAVLSAAIRCVSAEPGFVLVLDDAHALSAPVTRELVQALLGGLPTNSMVALASRSEPPVPIGRLRAHDAVVEIRMQDLAMAPAEAASLLRKAGTELEFEVTQALVRRTEGWPAALYLAALSSRNDSSLFADGARFGGDDHLFSDFLQDEVLSAVPPSLREFALATSVLDQMSGPLCDEVVGRGGSELRLAKLAAASQLLVPLESKHESYRWQHLVRDALRAELRRTAPELEPQLHLRASEWYGRHGDLDRAITHAIAAGDPALAGELLWPHILSYLASGRAAQVHQWLSNFSQETIAGSASLALSAAHAALALGNADEAQRYALSARALLARSSKSSRPRSAATGLCVIDALIGRTEASRMLATVAEASELEPDDSAWRPMLCLARGVAQHLLGERVAARSTLEEGADLSGSAQPAVAALCLSVNAMIAIENKEWDLAAELTDHAAALVEESGLTTCPTSALVFAASSAARAHEDRADEAKRDLRRATALLASLAEFIPWYGAEARVMLAHASLSLADAAAARTLLAEASRLARRSPGAVIFEHWFDEAWAYMDTLAESILAGPSSLTIAELRILRFLPSHRSFREIGTQLGVSANTVKTQAHAIYRKLGAASRSEAVARASEAGLISWS